MAASTTTGTSLDQDLTELADLYGVQTSYIDMGGRRIDANPESVILALRALGAPVRQLDDVASALAAKRAQLELVPEPVIVAWDGQLSPHSIKLPAGMKGSLVLEDE